MAVAPAAARPRPGGGRLFIIVGLLLAVFAFGAVFLIGNLSGGANLGGPPMQNVVVAKRAIPLLHQIQPSDVTLGKVATNQGVSITNTFPATSDVVNFISEINISAGSVITSDMLAKDLNLVPAGAAPAYLPLAKGYVAMTIPTGEQMGVAGHISVGDYITVIVSAQSSIFQTTPSQQAISKPISKTVFTNLRIIGLGPAVAGAQGAGGGSTGSGANTGVTSSLTVEITQCDAEFLTWFLSNTTVRYTLLSYKDYGTPPADNGDATCKQVSDAGGVSNKQVDAKFHFTSL